MTTLDFTTGDRITFTYQGYDVAAKVVPDEDSEPEGWLYHADDIAAWRNDEWSFVGVIVTVSRDGVELGSASLWDIDHGSDGDFDGRYLADVANEQLDEAVAEAAVTLGKLAASFVRDALTAR